MLKSLRQYSKDVQVSYHGINRFTLGDAIMDSRIKQNTIAAIQRKCNKENLELITTVICGAHDGYSNKGDIIAVFRSVDSGKLLANTVGNIYD